MILLALHFKCFPYILFPLAPPLLNSSISMAIKGSSLAFSAIAALFIGLLSTQLRRDAPYSHCIDFFFSPSFVNIRLCLADITSSHHRKPPITNQTICSDFPPGIPPPDTNTTTFLCVDRNGCCNFTSVQPAVNAVANFSSKRTVIWINKGIYL